MNFKRGGGSCLSGSVTWLRYMVLGVDPNHISPFFNDFTIVLGVVVVVVVVVVDVVVVVEVVFMDV